MVHTTMLPLSTSVPESSIQPSLLTSASTIAIIISVVGGFLFFVAILSVLILLFDRTFPVKSLLKILKQNEVTTRTSEVYKDIIIPKNHPATSEMAIYDEIPNVKQEVHKMMVRGNTPCNVEYHTRNEYNYEYIESADYQQEEN